MNRIEATRALARVDIGRRELAELVAEVEACAAARAQDPEQPRRAAADALLRELFAALEEEGLAPEQTRSLVEALRRGPDALVTLEADLVAQVRAAEAPAAERERRRLLLRCLELRERCLDHLDRIFQARRSSP